MKIGISLPFNNSSTEPRDDGDVLATDLRIALLGESLGFDSLWTVEHHFSDYCLAPDPLQTLTWLAAKTERVQLGSMVVVLPWWQNPVRVAEKVSLLDSLSGGRFILGIGRGAAPREFAGFGISMDDTRVRFNESAELVVQGLEQGFCEYDGEIIKQSKVAIRPRPTQSFKGRRFCAAVSPESTQHAAKLGLGLLINPQKPWEAIEKDIATHDEIYRSIHGEAPPPCVTSLTVYCDEDQARADEVLDVWVRRQAESAARHYGMASDEPSPPGSPENEAMEEFVQLYSSLQVCGTPTFCLERLQALRARTGTDHFVGLFSFAGIPEAMAEKSMRLFARAVLPQLQKQRGAPFGD